jgi:signal transduction histidine kinase
VTAVALRPRQVSLAHGLVAAAALGYGIAVAFGPPRSGALVTTYARASDAASAVDLAAGLALLAAGIVAGRERFGGSLGPLALLAGLVWFAPDWVGWEEGPPLARSLGMLIAPLGPALVLHVALAARRGRLSTAAARGTVAVAYTATVLASLSRALVRDPFEDPNCWSNCSDNVFLVDPNRDLARVFDVVGPATALAVSVVVVCVAAGRLARATGTARRALWAVLVPAGLAGAAEAAYAVALLQLPAEDPHRSVFATIFVARAAGVMLLAAGLAWVVRRDHRLRTAVARVGAEHEAAARARPLRDALALALDDPDLQVAYPLPGSERVVDATGAPLALPAVDSGRATTTISRGGEPVALVTHDVALLDGSALEREIGAAARLAVDNERLQAAVHAQLADLRASRARIVETGDEARRRLERDLHDGAQQRLLALSYELRLAHAEAAAAGDAELAAALTAATEEAQAAFDELRVLAHGIYPAILGEAGLQAALATLADTAALALSLRDVTPDRYPAAAETTAYLVVASAVEDAVRRGATHADITATRASTTLRVTVTDDGDEPRPPLQPVADRVGALGGRLASRAGGLEAEIPCA